MLGQRLRRCPSICPALGQYSSSWRPAGPRPLLFCPVIFWALIIVAHCLPSITSDILYLDRVINERGIVLTTSPVLVLPDSPADPRRCLGAATTWRQRLVFAKITSSLATNKSEWTTLSHDRPACNLIGPYLWLSRAMRCRKSNRSLW